MRDGLAVRPFSIKYVGRISSDKKSSVHGNVCIDWHNYSLLHDESNFNRILAN